MAGVRPGEKRKLGPFPYGVNNTRDEQSMPRDEFGRVVALREADNIWIDDAGKASRRDGYSEIFELTRGHSGWSDEVLGLALFVSGDALHAFEDEQTSTELVAGLAPGLPLSYCRLHDSVAWTNGVQSGEVMHDQTVRPWGAMAPQSAATAVAATGGALDAGTYQQAVAFVDEWGRESGARAGNDVDVGSNGAIDLTNIPEAPAGWKTRVYVSDGHGGKLRAAISTTGTSATISQRPKGKRCETLHLRPMPPGQCVAFGNGRQYVAIDRHVAFSPAMRYGQFDPRRSRVGFVKRVDMLAFVGDGTAGAGLFVADAKRTYFLAGADPADWKHQPVIGCGAQPGSLAWIPGDVWGLPTKTNVPTWITKTGRVAVGLPGGDVMYPQPTDGKPTAVMDMADRAALGYRDEGGRRQLIAALSGASPNAMAVQDKLTVRFYPHEVSP